MPAPQAIVHRPRARQQLVGLVAWAEDRLEEGSGHPLPAGVQRLQPCESEGLIHGRTGLARWCAEPVSGQTRYGRPAHPSPCSQPGVPHSAGVLHGTAHVRLVEGEEVDAGCACSPEHAHEVQSPVGIGTDVVDVCSPCRRGRWRSWPPAPLHSWSFPAHGPRSSVGGCPRLGVFGRRWQSSPWSCPRWAASCCSSTTQRCHWQLTSCRLESLPVTWQHS